MADTEKPDAKATDVAKPAKATPKAELATSHKMVTAPPTEDTPTTEPAAEKTGASATKGVRLEPLSKPEDVKPDEDKKEEAESTDSNDQDDDGNDLTSRDKLKDVDPDAEDLATKKAAERQANFDKIALAKTYYLPINQVVRRRSKRVAIIGAVLILLLCVAWVDVSLDAGLITIPGVEAPTHFFSK